MANGNGDGDRVISVRSWQVILMLAVQLIALGIAYGSLTERLANTTRDLQRMEDQRVVTQDDFDAWKLEMMNRMDRIENKIDNARR